MSAANIRGWARDVGDFPERALPDAIDVVDQAITQRLRADTGGDGAFSRGRNLGRASTTVTTGAGEAVVSASGGMAVWAILQGGTSGHEVRARRGRVLATPFGPRPVVHVGGVAARRTFSEAAERGLDDAERRLTEAWARVGG